MSSLVKIIAAKLKSLLLSNAVRSAFWVVIGSGSGQIIRLLGNLVLTRLLFPEVFGIMALITAVIIGLGQLSDIGLRQSVINSERVDDKEFMCTAWTIQVIQSSFIASMAIALSYPVAYFYDEPVIAPLMITVALSYFIQGFRSIALLAYDKRMQLKTQMLSDISVQLLSLIVVIAIAYLTESIWALAIGQLVGASIHVFNSYYFFDGHFSKFRWEKSSVLRIVGFGKWILISSIISYMTNQGDKLILGIYLTMGQLGIYSLASNWSSIVALVSFGLSFRVLHPYFKNALATHEDFKKIYTIRTSMNLAYCMVCLLLAIFGDILIEYLYDDRYIEAGWMLQILALGQVARSLTYTMMPFILATGDSLSQMRFSLFDALILASCLFAGGYFGGATGIIIAYTISMIISHPIILFFASRHGYGSYMADMLIIVGVLVFSVTAWWWFESPSYVVIINLIS